MRRADERLLSEGPRRKAYSFGRPDGEPFGVADAIINAEPRASNCIRIRRYRDRSVADSTSRSIEATLAQHGSISIRLLRSLCHFRSPMSVVCALICDGVLQTDLSVELGLDSLWRGGRTRELSLSAARWASWHGARRGP
jgi:hypothetical protein